MQEEGAITKRLAEVHGFVEAGGLGEGEGDTTPCDAETASFALQSHSSSA